MEKIEYNCPECETSNFVTLLGSKDIIFRSKCSGCSTELEMTIDKKQKLSVKPIENIRNKSNKKEIFRIDTSELDIEEGISKIKKEDGKAVPDNYPIYEKNKDEEYLNKPEDTVEFPKPMETGAVIIAVMIMISGILTFHTAWLLADVDNSEGPETLVSLVVIDENGFVANATISLDGKEVDTSMNNHNEYPIITTMGKHTLKVGNVTGYSDVTWDIFIAAHDNETLLGTEGLTRFTFELEEGNGTIEHEPHRVQEMYFSLFKYGPLILVMFGLISIWGARMAYRQKSYAGAQIGALFSIFGFGLLFVGPVLGIVSLIMLNRNRKLFSASFNKDNNRHL